MSACSRCGNDNLVPADLCAECASRFDPVESTRPAAAEAETACIDYLLKQVPFWSTRGLVTPETEGVITRWYACRRTTLLELAAGRAAGVAAPAAAPAMSDKLDLPDLSDAAPSPLGEFLEAHSLKILALLAALFIFVGMRQVLGRDWVGGVAILLIPLLPVGLSAIFWFFGIRTQNEKTVGGFAYCAVAIILAGFSAFAADKYWLGGSIDRPLSLFLAMASTTILSGVTLRKTRDPGYLHFLVAGIAATIGAALRFVQPLPLIPPAAIGIYGPAFLVLALLYFVGARAYSASRGEMAAPIARELAFWANVCAWTVLSRVTLPLVTGDVDPGESSLMLGAGAALYALRAVWRPKARTAYLAAGMASGSALLWLLREGTAGWYACGLALAGVCAAAMVLAAWHTRIAKGPLASGDALDSVADAYGRAARVAAAMAAFTLVGRMLGIAGQPLDSADWPLGVTLAGLCAGFYAAMALRNAEPPLLYVSAITGIYALALAADRMLATLPPFVYMRAAWDVWPAAGILLAAGIRLRASPREAADDMAGPVLQAASIALGVGTVIAAALAAANGIAGPVWLALAAWGGLGLAGSLVMGPSRPRLAYVWTLAAILNTASAAGVLAAAHTPAAPWTPPLAAGVALQALAWAWYELSDGFGRLRLSVAGNAVRAGAGTIALVGAVLATSGMNDASMLMAAAFVSALGLMVSLGARSKSMLPLAASFSLVLLLPLRLSSAAFDLTGAATPAVVAAIAFALATSVIYAIAASRLKQPDVMWLSAGSLVVAGGGGVLFGSQSAMLSRLAAELAGAGMFVGATGVGFAAAVGRRPILGGAAALILLAGHLRLVTLAPGFDRAWIGLAMLPAILMLLAVSHVSIAGSRPLRRSLYDVSITATAVILFIATAAAAAGGTHWLLPGELTLVAYAASLALAAQVRAEEQQPTGPASAAALMGGFVFALLIPRGTAASSIALPALAGCGGICAACYGRLAAKLARPEPAYGAVAAACGAWATLVVILLRTPSLWLSLAAAPLLAFTFAVGEWFRSSEERVLGAPLRRSAAFVAGCAVVWAIVGAELVRGRSSADVATLTLGIYGLLFVAGTARRRSPAWAAASAVTISLAFGYRTAVSAPNPAHWAWEMALAAAFWLCVCRGLDRLAACAGAARPIRVVLNALCGVAALTALLSAFDPSRSADCLIAFAVVGAVQLVFWRLGYGAIHAHAGVLAWLPAYALLLYRWAHIGSGALDFYLIPVGIYLVVLGHIAYRRESGFAGILWWLGLLTALGSAFMTFNGSYQAGGAPVHTALLLLGSVAAAAWGVVNRIRAFLSAGALFAAAFVVTMASGAIVEVWTGLFAIGFGIALLVAVFYVTINQGPIRRWMSRMGAEWRSWR